MAVNAPRAALPGLGSALVYVRALRAAGERADLSAINGQRDASRPGGREAASPVPPYICAALCRVRKFACEFRGKICGWDHFKAEKTACIGLRFSHPAQFSLEFKRVCITLSIGGSRGMSGGTCPLPRSTLGAP